MRTRISEAAMKLPSAYNAAMNESGGDLQGAAARLAGAIEENAELRAEVAAFAVAHLLEPFGSGSRALFEEVKGQSLAAFVAEVRPDSDEVS